MVEWRQQYAEPIRDEELRRRTAVYFTEDDDRTLQQYKDDADINTIVRRFGVTGEMPIAGRAPYYGDFSNVMDYHAALNAVREAESMFGQLPAELRKRFDNDPGKLLELVEDPDRFDELVELGLARAKPVAAQEPMADAPESAPEAPAQ